MLFAKLAKNTPGKINPMGFDFLRRVRRTSLVLGLLLGALITTYGGAHAGGAWMVGILWSLVNLVFIEELVRNALPRDNRRPSRIIIFGAIKFPILYFLGFIALSSGAFPVAWLILGFSWPFFVCTMKALGRVALGMDETESSLSTEQAGSSWND